MTKVTCVFCDRTEVLNVNFECRQCAVEISQLGYPRAYDCTFSLKQALRVAYGCTEEEYIEIVARPCGLCGTTAKARTVDHNHKTGKARGALCINCNLSIGQLETGKKSRKSADWQRRAREWIAVT